LLLICKVTGTTLTATKALLLFSAHLQATAAAKQCRCAGAAVDSCLYLRQAVVAAAKLRDK
jgi:hypothetical protein